MKAKLKYKGKEVLIEDLEKAEGIKQFTGLMCRKKETNALIFSFDYPGKHGIHSYFCKPFLAIWLNQGKIIEHRLISPNKPSIIPENNFNQLIEIPLNEKYKEVIDFFITNEKI